MKRCAKWCTLQLYRTSLNKYFLTGKHFVRHHKTVLKKEISPDMPNIFLEVKLNFRCCIYTFTLWDCGYKLLIPRVLERNFFFFNINPLGTNPSQWFKHTQKIRRLLQTKCLSLFDHFVWFALKGLRWWNISLLMSSSS